MKLSQYVSLIKETLNLLIKLKAGTIYTVYDFENSR